ncbi:cytochrome P450 [Amycolatopsis sp. WQ 127309]|uniref:cytochrome P450 n=1 Tax=Amycolatopsis sp. WQ 127309 TaxID=2932773 RepID=UPI001FF133C4|nr:cytochrome P450 [Amycolatopsis sp. WQ 127309]UOZ05531.1 cytochrome P450 [Amycolatopsis sp. WQ 127309]
MRISAGLGAFPVAKLSTVDLFDADFFAEGDPHPVWAAMRARAPLHRQVLPDGRSFRSVTRFHDACRVLGDHRVFTSERGSVLTQLGVDDISAGRMLVSTDPPRHGELRRPLNARLSARTLAAWDDRIRRAVLRFLEPALDGGEWDVAERAYELPMTVAGSLLGIPESDWGELVRWTAMAAAPDDTRFRVRSSGATLAIAHHQLFEYFGAQVKLRRDDDQARTDLIGHLMTMTAGGAPLTDEEVVYNCYSILLGANATTPHTVSGTILALAEHEGQLRRVLDDPGLAPQLVEEGLRWTSAANSFLRYAVADTELSGGRVEAGEAVAVWIGSANRDESVFADPYRFDVTRTDNRHIAFGHGPHYCLGATLARLTFRILFDEFFRRFGTIEVTGPPRHLASVFIAGLTSLPVRTR